MLIERWAALASQNGGRFLVLVIDEAQGMTQREWMAVVTAISPRLTRNGARG